jgi:RNA:NAD 2'-phosphotransferase (TPT1/KptA family)
METQNQNICTHLATILRHFNAEHGLAINVKSFISTRENANAPPERMSGWLYGLRGARSRRRRRLC